MASGRWHDRGIYFATPIIGIITIPVSLELGVIATSAHFLGGIYLSPDLDIVSRPYKRWGWMRWIWIPYQKFIPHRSPLSHFPVLDQVGRNK